MKRKNKKYLEPIAILTGDWHLRDTQPTARTDDFWGAQWQVVDEIFKLAWNLGQERDSMTPLTILHSGDLFNHWKPSPELLAKTIQVFKYWQPDFPIFRTIYGNHDLPQHNIELAYKSGIEVLKNAGLLEVLPGVHWQDEPSESDVINVADFKILVYHVMTWQRKEQSFKEDTSDPAKKLLKDNNFADIILTGHNHIPFMEFGEHNTLYNPGSITRQSASQINIEPRVYILHSDGLAYPYILPYSENELTTEHIEQKQERDERISAFVERLNKRQKFASFEDNLESLIKGKPKLKKILNDLKLE